MGDELYTLTKILTPNDLGETGSHQAGFAVPKKIIEYFPYLNPRIPNPECFLIVQEDDLTEHRWRFIYYNNRLHGRGTRNEYRLTQVRGFLNAHPDVRSGDILRLQFIDTFHLKVSLKKVGHASNFLDRPSEKERSQPASIVIRNVNSWTVSRVRI